MSEPKIHQIAAKFLYSGIILRPIDFVTSMSKRSAPDAEQPGQPVQLQGGGRTSALPLMPRQTRAGPVFGLPALAHAMPQFHVVSHSTLRYITSVSIKCVAAASGAHPQSEYPLRFETPLMIHQPEEGTFEEQGSFTLHALSDDDDQLFVRVGRCVEEAARAAVLDSSDVPERIKDSLRTCEFNSRWQATSAGACLVPYFVLLTPRSWSQARPC